MAARLRTAIIGAGGHGRVVREIVSLQAHLEPVAFYDDDLQKSGLVIDGTTVAGTVDLLRESPMPVDAVVVAIGIDGRRRAQFFGEMGQLGYEMVSLIHPFSFISKSAHMGRGLVVMAGVTVGPGTEIGDDVLINTAASVDHDCRLDDHCSVLPNASIAGGVHIGTLACVGQNASVNQYLRIGPRSVVGAGAVVIADVPEDVVVVGVPARVTRSFHEEEMAE